MTRARSKRILINLNFYDLENKPLVYPPEAHTHAIVDVDGLELALDDLQDQIDTLDTDKASKSYARHLGAFVPSNKKFRFFSPTGETIRYALHGGFLSFHSSPRPSIFISEN